MANALYHARMLLTWKGVLSLILKLKLFWFVHIIMVFV